jgi:hypothetical protein
MAPTRYAVERKFARYDLDVRAKLSAGEKEITVRTLDISEGGVGLVSPVEIAEGSSFSLECTLPTVSGNFRAEIEEKSRSGFRYGFSFLNVDESSVALLRKYQRRWGIFSKDDYAAKE